MLLSHPNEGEEKGLLSKILSALEEQDFIIYGKHEEGTFNSSVLHSGHKGVANRSQLDHFEKWLGIVKIDACHRNKQEQKGLENKHQGLASPDQLASKDDRSEANGPLVDALRIAHKSRPWIARRVDLILVPHPQFAYAHLGWIGSRMFNRSIRRYADKEMNMKLTSHGLYDYAKVSMRGRLQCIQVEPAYCTIYVKCNVHSVHLSLSRNNLFLPKLKKTYSIT